MMPAVTTAPRPGDWRGTQGKGGTGVEPGLSPDHGRVASTAERAEPHITTLHYPHIEMVTKEAGPRAIIRGTRVAVRTIVAYRRMGLEPQAIVTEALPHLTLAQVEEALDYYVERAAEIDRELAEDSEEAVRAWLERQLANEGHPHISGSDE